MQKGFFANGTAKVGAKELEFSKRLIRQRFQMYVPTDFSEDQNLVSNYTYLFSRDKSPLSIAIKFSPARDEKEKEKLIAHYFSQPVDTLESDDSGAVYYRETVTSGQQFGIYSLRFSVEVDGGLLFGCFNCAADYREDWRPVVLEMLRAVEPAEKAS